MKFAEHVIKPKEGNNMGMAHKIVSILLSLGVVLVLADEEPHTCNVTNSARVEYEYSTAAVGTEHIITFNGYFLKSTRENYVTAALKNAGVSLMPLFILFDINFIDFLHYCKSVEKFSEL